MAILLMPVLLAGLSFVAYLGYTTQQLIADERTRCVGALLEPPLKAAQLRRSQARAVIVGSSVAGFGVDPEHLPEPGAYNLGLAFGTMRTARETLDAALRLPELQAAYLVLDFAAFQAHQRVAEPWWDENTFDESSATQNLSWATLHAVTRRVWRAGLPGLLQNREACRYQVARTGLYQPTGQGLYPGLDAAQILLSQEHAHLGWVQAFAGAFAFVSPVNQADTLTDFRLALRAAYARGIRLTVIMAPRHIRLEHLYAAVGYEPSIGRWMQELVAINEDEALRAGRAAFPLWDFAFCGGACAELPPADGSAMHWWLDINHFTPALGAEILAALAGKASAVVAGRRLDSSSVDEHLAWRAARVAELACAYPQDHQRLMNSLSTAQYGASELQFAAWAACSPNNL